MKRLVCLLICAFTFAVGARPMNVIFILADDLGWSDTTLYGQTKLYQTPNIERLAARGMTFNRAYAASPLCSPTRSSILTGRNPARTGLTIPNCHLPKVILEPLLKPTAGAGDKAFQLDSVSRLDTKYPTLGKLLKGGGYATGHFGKWHLGPEPYSPLEHGFDVDVPHFDGPGPKSGYIAPWNIPGITENYPKENLEDRMTEEAIAWMQSVDTNTPFYMNVWQFSVHTPFQAKAELLEKYKALVDLNDPQHSPTYAAMVETLDDAVGSLLDAVDAAGIAESTAIIFLSDNGGNMYAAIDGGYPTSNAPLRGGKATLYEGGTRVPCIVAWPGMTEPGSRSDVVIQTMDFYPTLLSLLNIPLPADYAIDGLDLTEVLKGGGLDRDDIITYFPHVTPKVPDWLTPAISILSDDWKLIREFYQGEDGAHRYLLFNLKEDIGETNNVAAAYPERVAMLDRKIEAYIQGANVFVPVRNPDFDLKKYAPEKEGVPVVRKPRKK